MTVLGFPAVYRLPCLPQYRLPVSGRLLVGPTPAGRVNGPRPSLIQAGPATSAGSSLEDLLGLGSNLGATPPTVKVSLGYFLEGYLNG